MNKNSTKTILLVDDEPGILSSLHRLLRREGWNLLMALGGQDMGCHNHWNRKHR